MAEQTPRVNATTLQSFTGKTVRIIGKVTQLHGDTASIDARGTVQIHLERVPNPVPLPLSFDD